MRWIIFALGCATACSPGFGSVIESMNVSCEVGEQNGDASVSGTNACSLTGKYGLLLPRASATIQSDLPASFGPATSFSGSVGLQAIAWPGTSVRYELNLGADAIASVSWFVTATTDGPIRPGFIHLSISGSIDSFDGWGQYWSQVGPYSTGFGQGMLPFTLGTPFDIGLSATAYIFASDQTSGGSAVSNAITFSLFEADGVTPVQLLATPEPGTVVLVAAGLIFGVLRRFRRSLT